MSQERNIRIAKQLVAGYRRRRGPQRDRCLFRVDVQFEIAGDVGALTWIGRRIGRDAVSGFIGGARRLIEHLRFDVRDILASDSRAVIVGELTTKIDATGKILESAFALILTISNGEIARFQMLEGSFASLSGGQNLGGLRNSIDSGGGLRNNPIG